MYLLLSQYYEHIEEMEWAIEVCKEFDRPVAASMCIGPEGDLHGISAGECAVRMARAGANVGKEGRRSGGGQICLPGTLS